VSMMANEGLPAEDAAGAQSNQRTRVPGARCDSVTAYGKPWTGFLH